MDALKRRAILFAAVVAVAGLVFIFLRFTAAPARIVIVNGSGRRVASVIVISGDQRVDIGEIGNGESRKVVCGSDYNHDSSEEIAR